MLTNIRKPEPQDLNYILDIDLKCFEDNWSYSEWRTTLADSHYGVLLGTCEGVPVGFIVWFNDGKDSLIVRLGVKKDYRNRNVGSQLLQAVEVITHQQGLEALQITVTESLCCPNTKTDVSSWLIKRGYHASGLVKEAGIFFGQKEDEITFCKYLEGAIKHGC
jgi:GNAT superfamily N-acetyltransferase